jgi:hypothetical protein
MHTVVPISVLFYLISPIAVTTGFSFSGSVSSHDLLGKKRAREQVMIFAAADAVQTGSLKN